MKDLAAYSPTEGALIYHYCSPSTLLAILQSNCLRLGDIGEMNDSMERQWGLDALQEELSTRQGYEDTPFMEVMERAIYRASYESLTLASCFSIEGDRLSQWRAYAENGAGFAIGFDPKALQRLPISLLEVCYDPQTQVERIADGVDHIIEMYERIFTPNKAAIGRRVSRDPKSAQDNLTDGVNQQIAEFTLAARFLTHDLVAFKSRAFSEEREVRIVHHVSVNPEDGTVELVPTQHPNAWPDGRQPKLGFLMRGSVPSCYMDMPISTSFVKEVVVGPRAAVQEDAIQRLLSTLGYKDVKICTSSASYR
ncbi:hypothetical protein B8X02_17690 [Stenotrophomonas rhizophila]|uniref:DUF2971 domain-containing protein n=1 Tax=Stenotrophomonas rhizophila TaxID=216778 RepID=UPI000BA73EF8|nr:DUF2971 domain-containing protein [Stenotrophomonas rhizophila]PAK89417.1 hypothetical protein B8X02_17690 [Stenotrophomonas rhizophila]